VQKWKAITLGTYNSDHTLVILPWSQFTDISTFFVSLDELAHIPDGAVLLEKLGCEMLGATPRTRFGDQELQGNH
jgi:hypothetical protein